MLVTKMLLISLLILIPIMHDSISASAHQLLVLVTPHGTFPLNSSPQLLNFYGSAGANSYSPVRKRNGGSALFTRDYFKNKNHDHSHVGPFYQRSIPQELPSPPRIQHLIIKEDGSAMSDMIWQEHDSKIKNQVKEVAIQPVFFENDNALLHNTPVMVGKEDDVWSDKAASSSTTVALGNNGSGSVELSLMRHPLPFLEKDKHAATTAVTVEGNTVRCIQPQDLEGNQARYDPVTGRCYTIGTRGPCGKLMIFTTLPGDNFNGICSCDYDSFDRPLVPVGGQCHFLYTQAMCYPGFWLTSVTSTLEPVCEPNPCHNSQRETGSSKSRSTSGSKPTPLVFFQGECVPLNSPSRHCQRDGEVVLFPKASNQPACGFHPSSKKRIHRRQISNIRYFRCRPGERRNRITKRCARITKTYF